MSQNYLPENRFALALLGGKMINGSSLFGVALGLTQFTPAIMQPVLTAFTNANNAYITARTYHQAAADSFAVAEESLYQWLLKAKRVLTGRLGGQWSAAWAAAGFINHSTAVPKKFAERMGVVGQLVNYFTANPTYEVPSMDVTDTGASQAHYTATTANTSLSGAVANMATKLQTLATAEEALRKLMRGLIDSLKMVLGKNDPRWEQFGLNRPAAPSAPTQPQNLTVQPQPGHTILAMCDATPLAMRYRWRIKVVGVDEAFRLAVSTKDPRAEITKVAAGQAVDVLVQAVNGPSQGVASAVVRVVLPPVVAAAAPAVMLAPVAPVIAATAVEPAANGNGAHRNGNGTQVDAVVPRV